MTVTPYYNDFAGTAATANVTTAAAPNNAFVRVTAEDLANGLDGEDVIIVDETNRLAMTKTATGTNAAGRGRRTGESVEIGAATSTTPATIALEDGSDVDVITLEADGTDYKLHSSDDYYYTHSAAQNYFDTDATTHNTWTIAINNNEMTINDATAHGSDTYGIVYNTGSSWFCVFKTSTTSGRNLVWLYKRSATTLQNQAAPTGVAYSNVAWNGATISWDAVSTATNGYTVTYTATGGEPQTLEVAAGTTQATLSLAEGTEYAVTVHANATGTHKVSPESTPAVTFTTLTLTRVTYNKVTAAMLAESDADAYQYIFVAPTDAAVMGGNDEDARVGIAEGVIIDSENDQAKVPTGAAISLFTIEKDGTSYYFYDGTYYLATKTGEKIYSIENKNDATMTATWNVDADQELITTTLDSGKAIRFNYASNYFKFRLYGPTAQHGAWLYRSTTKIPLAAPEVKGVADGGTYRFANITIGVPTSATSVEYTLTQPAAPPLPAPSPLRPPFPPLWQAKAR